MKRNIFKLIALSIITISVSGCSRVNVIPDNTTDLAELSVTPVIASAQSKISNDQAVKSKWTQNDKFGLYATLAIDLIDLTQSQIRQVDYTNIEFTCGANGAFTTNKTMYFPYKKQALNLWGIYPFDRDITNKDESAYEWSVPAVQNETTIAAADLMVAKNENVDPQSTPVPLEFKHKMTHIVIDLLMPLEIDGRTITELKSVSLNSLKLDAKYDFNEDLVTVDHTAVVQTITPRLVVKTEDVGVGTEFEYEAIIVPQTITSADVFLKVIVGFDTVDGGAPESIFTFKFPTNTTFAQGEEHVLSLSFDTDFSIRLNGSSIQDWNTDNSFDFPEKED